MLISKSTELILDSISAPILIIDHKKRIIYANSSYVNLIDINKKELVGQNISDIRPDSRIGEVLTTGIPIRRLKRENKDSHFFSDIFPIIADGTIKGAISTSFEKESIEQLLKRLEITEKNVNMLKNRIYSANYTFDNIIGQSLALEETIKKAKLFANKKFPILINGESGTGKELFAQSIHNYSQRKDQPFIAINCATLENSLLESELFGYEAGSFTGATEGGKKGLFEEANNGTLFLDEITEISISTQSKLLRVIQEQTIRPLGASKEIPVNVRIICSSNKDMKELIATDTFKEDLFYRISTFSIFVPPLRERTGDISLLTDSFTNKDNTHYTFTPDLIEFLDTYEWPGNIRELKNVIEFMKAVTPNDLLNLTLLPDYLKKSLTERSFELELANPTENMPLSDYLKTVEKKYINHILNKHGHTTLGKTEAAKELQISLASLYNKLR